MRRRGRGKRSDDEPREAALESADAPEETWLRVAADDAAGTTDPGEPAGSRSVPSRRPPAVRRVRATSVAGPARTRLPRAMAIAGAPAPMRHEERRYHRARPMAALLGVVVLALTAGLGVYGVINAGFFRVRQVEVLGAELVDPYEVARVTGAAGQDLFRVDAEAARRNVERVPGVKSVSVRKVFPRRLVVTVQERRPEAVWSVSGAGYAVDAEGVVLDFIPDPSMLTIYQTDPAAGITVGDRVDADAVTLAQRLRTEAPSVVGQQMARFEWSQRAGLEITTDKGIRVRFGDSGNVEYKLAVWRGILDQTRRDKVTVSEIDLRFGDRVVYR